MKVDNFDGRCAVITGGAAGIGRALAEEILDRGGSVMIADLPGDTLDAAASSINVEAVACDVADSSAVDRLADAAMAKFGKVDLLFNNAGVGLQQSLYRVGLKDWRWCLDANLWGVVHGIKSFMPHLTANPNGAYVVNTASLFSLYTGPGMATYAASKWAVLALTETLAQEVRIMGHNLGVTAFCPGPIETTIYGSRDRRDARYVDEALDVASADPLLEALANITNVSRMSARDAANIALRAVADGRFWAITHPQYTSQIGPEHETLMAAIEEERARQAGE